MAKFPSQIGHQGMISGGQTESFGTEASCLFKAVKQANNCKTPAWSCCVESGRLTFLFIKPQSFLGFFLLSASPKFPNSPTKINERH